MQVCKCGSFKIENKDLSLCASCNKARLKADKPAAPAKVYTLKRSKLKPQSAKGAAATAAKIKTQKAMREQGVRWCETCGRTGIPLSHSHIIPVGQYKQFEDVAENQIYECFGSPGTCHEIWEHGTMEQRMAQATFDRKIKVIARLCPQYLEQLILNGTRKANYESVRSMVFESLRLEG